MCYIGDKKIFSVISVILHFSCSTSSRLFIDTNMRDFDRFRDIYVVNFVFSLVFTVSEENKREREKKNLPKTSV